MPPPPLTPLRSPVPWTTVSIAGHRCEIYAPPDPLPGRGLIYLHDLDGAPRDDEHLPRDLIEPLRMPVIAPQTGRSWWLDKIVPAFDAAITPERYVVEHVREEFRFRFGISPPGIALLGAGMGGQGALRIAYRHPAVFPVAAAVSPAIDFHVAMRESGSRDDGERFDTLWELFGDVERARQETCILHVHPLNWPRHQFFASDPADLAWHDGAARLHSKLAALGIPHTALLERRDARADVAAALSFIAAALDQESRRLST